MVDFLQGKIGIPYGGFPEPFRSRVLKDKEARALIEHVYLTRLQNFLLESCGGASQHSRAAWSAD